MKKYSEWSYLLSTVENRIFFSAEGKVVEYYPENDKFKYHFVRQFVALHKSNVLKKLYGLHTSIIYNKLIKRNSDHNTNFGLIK